MGVTLNFNLFDGAPRPPGCGSREHANCRPSHPDQMASAVRLQVREAYLNLSTAQKRLEVVRDARSQAAESLRITQNRFEVGLATITELLRAETARLLPTRNSLNAMLIIG